MAYRDPTMAARAHLNDAKEACDALEERITPALLEQLPKRLATSLHAASRKADSALKKSDKKKTIEAYRAATDAFEVLAGRLEEAIAKAPKLGREFNRLPRAYAERVSPRFEFHFPDIFSPAQLSLRASLHAIIDAMDPKARLFDRRAGYFDNQAAPYLVEACFRTDYHPLRLQVSAWQQMNQRTMGNFIDLIASYCLVTGVRPSTPELAMKVNGVKSGVLAMFGMLRDTEIGASAIDEAFVIEADDEDAERVLTPEVQRAFENLMKHGEVSVFELDGGLARVEWQEDITIKSVYRDGMFHPAHAYTSHGLPHAVDVLTAIRAIPATPLLRRLERHQKRR